MIDNFPFQPTRREFAQQCFPDLDPAVAVKRLNRLIQGDPELLCLLLMYGYRPRSRRLTLRQVRVIRERL